MNARRTLPPAKPVLLDRGAVPGSVDGAAEARVAVAATEETPEAGFGREDQAEGRTESNGGDASGQAAEQKPAKRIKAANSRGRVRRSAGDETRVLDDAERNDWRWRLRATAGKLSAAEKAADQAAQQWERLVEQARQQGVPEIMLLAALTDAGISDHADYL